MQKEKNKVLNKVLIDKIMHYIFLGIGLICASSIILIVAFIFIKGLRPFVLKYDGVRINLFKFLFGTSYTTDKYGVLGLVINTIVIVAFSALLALPISVLSALFIVQVAPKKLGIFFQMIVELLAAIPSIIYGLFGTGVINPLVRDLAKIFSLQTAGGISMLSVIIVLTMMIVPTITMLSITSMRAVKKDLISASLALGATKSQTNYKIVIGGAKSGIFAALILGIGRAMGEATAVSMVCGGATGIAISLFSPTATITSTMIQGIHESTGLNYDIRFSLGIVLIVIIFVTNVALNLIKKRISKNDH